MAACPKESERRSAMARLLQGTFIVILACFAVGDASAQAMLGGDCIGGFNVAERIRGGHLRFPTESAKARAITKIDVS